MDHDDPERRISDLENRLSVPAEPGRLSAAQVHDVAFSKPPIGKRGYNEDEVDAFLDRIEATLRGSAMPPLTADDVRTVAFSKPPIGKRGYNEDEVDAFLDVVATQLVSGPAARPSADPLPSARHGGKKHGTEETWPRRVLNAVTDFVAWVLD